MNDKVLGKITFIDIENVDGYFGLFVTLEGNGYGVTDFIGKDYLCDKIKLLMEEAKVSTLSSLKNKPVEIIFEDNTLKKWRILKEVL